jgi:hypothetical protein
MKPVIVHLKLPDDLSAKARELAGKRPVRDVILEALREQWLPPSREMGQLERNLHHFQGQRHSFDPSHGNCPACEPEPEIEQAMWGSIPAEQKRA